MLSRSLIFLRRSSPEANVTSMSARATPNEADPTIDETLASIIRLHQPKKAKAQRPRAARKPTKRKAKVAVSPDHESVAAEPLIPEAFLSAEPAPAELPAPPPTIASRAATPGGDARSRSISAILFVAALALAGVGVAMNGWFARSLGSTDMAGWLFLAIGVAADLVALVMPSCAARLWQMRHRATSLAGWGVWTMTFVFAVMAGVGFASINIADATLVRASRLTPAVALAQAALTDDVGAGSRGQGRGRQVLPRTRGGGQRKTAGTRPGYANGRANGGPANRVGGSAGGVGYARSAATDRQ